MPLLGVRLIGLTQLKASFDQFPATLQDRLRIFMARFTLQLRDQVRSNILSRFKVVTGEFPDAVQSESVETLGGVTGRVFIDSLPWAAIQERGGKTHPHTISPAGASALAFLMPSRLGFSKGNQASAYVFAKQVNHPGSDIPERSYARLALVQMRAPFEGGIREVVNQSINESFSVAAE
jgi:hypothetical protein